MKILITGGKGFIGSHLAKALNEHIVTIFDLPNSITDFKSIINTVERKFDVVYHLAGLSGTVNLNPEKSFSVNVRGTINLLEAVRLYSPKTRVIFSNSRQEYGKPQYLPVDENHPQSPTNHYGVHKLSVTLYAQLYHQLCRLDTVVLRTSNIYGPDAHGFRPYNIVNQWLSQAKKGKNIILFGSGQQLRDYLYIDDFITLLIKAGTHPRASGHIFNIGYGQGRTLSFVANTIAKKFGVKVITKPWPKDWESSETGSYVSNIHKAQKLLSWKPTISVNQGIEKVTNTFRQGNFR